MDVMEVQRLDFGGRLLRARRGQRGGRHEQSDAGGQLHGAYLNTDAYSEGPLAEIGQTASTRSFLMA